MIQRYDLEHDGTLALDATPNGEYVRYADIEPLQRIKDAAEKLIASCSGGNLDFNTVEVSRSLYLELVKAVQRPWEPTDAN
jgi:hypothetical protein